MLADPHHSLMSGLFQVLTKMLKVKRNSSCNWVLEVDQKVRQPLHFQSGRVGCKHQVMNWFLQLLTQDGFFDMKDLGLVLQSLSLSQELANELPDCNPCLESTEGRPKGRIPAMQAP